MPIKKVIGLYFSPTTNTKNVVINVVTSISKKLNIDANYIDITLDRSSTHIISNDELLVIGLPTYAGRIPNKIEPYIRQNIKGNTSQCVVITTYGNRSQDESAKELSKLMIDNNFVIKACFSICTEHAFACIGTDRPNETDYSEIEQYTQKTVSLLNKNTMFNLEELFGNSEVGPYYVPKNIKGEPVNFLKAKPVTDTSLCDACGTCKKVCPMHNYDESYIEASGVCIKCQACIKYCPKKAKKFIDENFLSHKMMLENNYGKVKGKNYFFLSKVI